MSKYKLVLDKIGKFKNTNFDLEDVTVFYGPNEVGKTTVIDGVINAMAEGRKNQHITREILEPRYGDDISTKLKLNSNNEEINKVDHDLVKNLLLVRASELSLSVEGSWIESVKNKLFTGGVNPGNFIDVIDLMESKKTQKSKSPLYDVKNLDKKLKIHQQELTDIKTEISGFGREIEEQGKLKGSVEKLNEKLQSVTIELTSKQAQLVTHRNIIERDKIVALQAKLTEQRYHEKNIEESNLYTEEIHQSIETLEGNIVTRKSEWEANKTTFTDNETKLKKTIDKIKNKVESIQASQKHHDMAQNVINRLEIQISESEKHNASKINMTTVFVSLGLIALGIGALVFIETDVRFTGIIPLAIGVGVLIKAFLTQSGSNDSSLDLKVEVRGFNQNYDGSPSCPDDDYASVTTFLRKIIQAHNESLSGVDNEKSNENELKRTLEQIKAQQEKRKTKLDEMIDELKTLLPGSVKDGKDYFQLLQSKKGFISKLREIEILLKKAEGQLGVNTRDKLIEHIQFKIIEFNKTPITEEAISQNEFTALERDVSALQSRKEDINQELIEAGTDLTRSNTEININVGNLTNDQLELEKNISELNLSREAKQLEMDSLLLLKSIIDDIDEDTSQKFQVLSEGINEYMQIILGEEREIVFENLTDVKNVVCHDLYGEEIEVDQLSSGTQDAFYLSARLAFLERVELQDDAFLILDDPFVFMDETREEKAIEAIHHYHDKQPHPILFFTKDEETKNRICAAFNSAKEIVLTK